MRLCKYLAAVWVAVAVYSVFSLFFGAMGFSAQKQLMVERERLWENMRDLHLVNEELEDAKNSLFYDQDTIAVYARQLGYGREGERFVRIVGLGGAKNSHAAAGQVFFAGTPDFVPDKTIKIAALCAGLVVFVFCLIMDLLRSKTP
jgi:cell division protein FtsB